MENRSRRAVPKLGPVIRVKNLPSPVVNDVVCMVAHTSEDWSITL
jgi:hypothetical protein